MSRIVQTRICTGCGTTFKVESRSRVTTCWECGQAALRAQEDETASRHAEAMVEHMAAHAGEDPFVGVYGQDLSVGMRVTGAGPQREARS